MGILSFDCPIYDFNFIPILNGPGWQLKMVGIEQPQTQSEVLNIARGTTHPGYRVYNLSYLSS